MISVVKHKFRNKDELRDAAERFPHDVHVDGVLISSGKKWGGTLDKLPYGQAILVKHSGKEYGFQKRTDDTVVVY